ncbi:hypothetical protein [Ensifer sp. B1-9]|uniref:hypothetical protein n=1 Tax=Ensifer sp. B1-9 TaxID=3141455 RepID=UPI003D224D65
MQSKHRVMGNTNLSERLDDSPGTVLLDAMRAAASAWTILAAEIQRLGYTAERPVPEDGNLYSYFDAIKWDALEMSDSVYGSLSVEDREKDDRDLEEFEATFSFRDEYSPRITALAFLTIGKFLIGDA